MRRPAALLALLVLLTGCGEAAASPRPRAARTVASAVRTAAPAAPTAARPVDRLTAIARLRYAIESHGATARAKLHRVGADPVLRRTLASGDVAAMRRYVRGRFRAVWYGWHVSRVRVLRGSQVLEDAGVPFVVAPSQMTLRGAGGPYTLQVSIQDEIGFVKFTYRNDHVWAVVRGTRPGDVRTLLPAAAHARLPAHGKVRLAGRRYAVRSFREAALGGEPVRVWILAPA
jgi:hypothetical protein